MNYSILYPNIMKIIPKIEPDKLKYYYDPNYNVNKKINIYIPYGKKYLIWFTKYNGNNYSFLIELKKNIIKNIKFIYSSFCEELTNGNGTIIYGTVINNNFCCEKLIYFMGNEYNEKYIMKHIDKMKYIIEYYFHELKGDHFLNLYIPFISINQINIIQEACNLSYRVYEIKQNNNSSIKINNYSCNFKIKVYDELRDIYELYYYQNGTYKKYYNAYINDLKTSSYLRNKFNSKLKTYENIELSDDEDNDDNDDNDDNNNNNKEIETNVNKEYIITCVYIPNLKKWKPYFFVNNSKVDNYQTIKIIENKIIENKINK